MDVSDFEEFEEKSESKCLRVKVAIGSMCGPRDVAVDSPSAVVTSGESMATSLGPHILPQTTFTL